ncbi:MAG: NAD(P)/FAD-dependent oxidoreductase [Thermoleophilia bacterium]
MARFDAVVMGSGSGGRAVAGRLADGGMDVAMAEEGAVGGECPYWACMPSKALLRPPEAVWAARRVPGVEASIARWDEVAAFRDEVTSGWDDARKAARYTARGVTILRGRARIAGPGRVAVGGATYATERIVVATGTAATIPPVDGIGDVAVWTNREVMEMRAVPASAVVLGAGPVGVEIGQALARYGAAVTIADPADRPLPAEDPAVGDLLSRRLRGDGIDVLCGNEAVAVARDGDGVRVTFADGATRRAARLVVAAGRSPRVEGIGLETVGVTPDATGIPVDDRCRAADGVWALGDVTGAGLFTHVAAYQGRIAAADILGEGDLRADYSAVPRAVFCDPEVAAVGLTAARARDEGRDVATATVDLADIERASTYGRDVGGLVGVVADRGAGVLVGAHAVGPLASEWIHLAVLAVRARVPLPVVADVIAQFPTFAEALVAAVRALDG